MNSRFSILKSSVGYDEFKKSKNDTKEGEKARSNIFKQKSKTVQVTQRDQPSEINLFRKSRQSKQSEFNLETESFPGLSSIITSTIKTPTNYLEKIKQTNEKKKGNLNCPERVDNTLS